MNLKEVKELLMQYDAAALKKYGQNFLIDDHILAKIGKTLANDAAVIEIGPGLGSLTRYLVKDYPQVLCYEIDPKMALVIKDTIPEAKLIVKDFLQCDINKDIDIYIKDKNIYLISNLPYYITTPILLKVLEEVPRISKMVVMMQKEVAMRFLGKPKTEDYNSLSVLVQTYMNVEKVMDVARSSFYPAPDVDSVVLKFERKDKPLYDISNEQHFKKINRLIFAQRRKTIVNNLKDIYNKEKILASLQALGKSESVRSEELSVEEIIKLSNLLK